MNPKIEKKEKVFGKGEITLLAQLLNAMKDSVDELEKYYEKKDLENFNSAKKEILDLQRKIDKVLT